MTFHSACAALLTLATPAAVQDESKLRANGSSIALDQVPSTSASPDLNMQQPAATSPGSAVISADVPVGGGAKTLTAAPIAGSDLCDREAEGPHSDLCRQRMEARAEEFTRPHAAPITPEGRLLLLTGPLPDADVNGRQLTPMLGLNDRNGPAEQLAGALQSQLTEDPLANKARPIQGAVTPIPAGVPPVVILPKN